MELTANEAEVGGRLKKKKEKEKAVYIKYKDRHLSRTYMLDNTMYKTRVQYRTKQTQKHTLNLDKTLNIYITLK